MRILVMESDFSHSQVNLFSSMSSGVSCMNNMRCFCCCIEMLFGVSSDLDDPVVTVHQSIGEAKEQFYYERTVFLRCVANSNPPIRYSWHRGRDVLSQGTDKGVEIYEPFFTQVRM